MTFAKNANYDYVLTSSSFDDGVYLFWSGPPIPMCYEQAMRHFVGTNRYSTRYGVNGFGGAIVLTDIAEESLYENGYTIIKTLPGATLAIEGSNLIQYEGFTPQTLIIEFADPRMNITFGKDGVSELSAIPITEDLIGIFNVDENRYEMKFERYVRTG